MVNRCSLKSSIKRLQLAALINEHNYDIDIIMGCESHHISPASEVFPMNYVVYRKDRSIGAWWKCFCSYKGDLNYIIT